MIDNKVYTYIDYGCITINLKQILKEKKISRSKLSRSLALNYNTINRYYNNKVTRVDLDVIARICYVLNCDVNDILKYTRK